MPLKKVRLKVGSNLVRLHQKLCALPSTPLELMLNKCLVFSLDEPNHTLVGGISVNSLCQQGMLFAGHCLYTLRKSSGSLSVSHSELFHDNIGIYLEAPLISDFKRRCQ